MAYPKQRGLYSGYRRMSSKQSYIEIQGARENNLRDLDLNIPRGALVVITGLSGSGKSSLAFDTIYAEGQRRYIESFSAYARQFLGGMERPDVDSIRGLSPVVSIEQKTTNKNPRSTVGTITEIYDFLRLLYARAGEAFSYVTGEPMVRYSDDQIIETLLRDYQGLDLHLLAPLVKGRKGHYRELFERTAKNGYLKVRVDGEIREITHGMKLDRYKVHDIEVLVDTISMREGQLDRLRRSAATALKMGKGSLLVQARGAEEARHFSRHLMCPTSGISYEEPAPNLFSFNSPYGACPSCNGLGTVLEIDREKIFPDPSLSIKKGGVAPLGTFKNNWIFRQLELLGKAMGFDLTTPVGELDAEVISALLQGTSESISFRTKEAGVLQTVDFEGIGVFIQQQAEEAQSKRLNRWAQGFMQRKACPECEGSRLKKEAMYFRMEGYNIAELAALDLKTLQQLLEGMEDRLPPMRKAVATEVLKEVRKRLGFLLDVGLAYLSLDRPARSLSGGEAQRIRLATQIGAQLVGVLYILDEPSIGLHQRDNDRLIEALKKLRDGGNSVLVVEHDKDMMLASDYLIDIGPGAGQHGGRVMAEGTVEAFLQQQSQTAKYLSGALEIAVPKSRRKGNGKYLELLGATGHNLKSVDLKLPLGMLVCVTGVSGSGKSSLINETLYPLLAGELHRAELVPLTYAKLKGSKSIDKVIRIDQSPIGRTPRSNPATYTGVFSDIRNLFALLPEAKIRGYKPGRFSFNVKGGRCETCGGAGLRVIEMNFLPDVEVTCETCLGKRYNRETLEVRYKGHSIADVLNLTIEQAVDFFSSIPVITRKIGVLNEIGLGYLTLGQSSTTLSGGEAQRVKLASELNRTDTGKTLYILDEPTTGLHFEDIRMLLDVLNKLVDKGNTVLVIEHNMDVIKSADHLIDLGPEGGREGGQILFSGLPEALAQIPENHTGRFLAKELIMHKNVEQV